MTYSLEQRRKVRIRFEQATLLHEPVDAGAVHPGDGLRLGKSAQAVAQRWQTSDSSSSLIVSAGSSTMRVAYGPL